MSQALILKEASRIKIPTDAALATTKESGYIHAIGSFCGLIAEGIRGTGDEFVTGAVKGHPTVDGVGEGLGDLVLKGVHAVALASGITLTAHGSVLYGDVADNRANEDSANPLLGWSWPMDDGTFVRDPVADDPAWLQAINTADGEKVVHVLLAGFPKTGLV